MKCISKNSVIEGQMMRPLYNSNSSLTRMKMDLFRGQVPDPETMHLFLMQLPCWLGGLGHHSAGLRMRREMTCKL